MKKTGKRQAEQGSSRLQPLAGLLRGTAAAAAVTLLVTAFFAYLIWNGTIRQKAEPAAAAAACFLGAMTGGFAAEFRHRELSLLLGPGTGLVLFALLLAAGIAAQKGAFSPDCVPIVFSACILGGGAAGILGRKKKKKHRR